MWRRAVFAWLPFVVMAALVAPACAATRHAASLVWHPLRRQPDDSATTFLFNAATARTQPPGNGGFMMGDSDRGDLPWTASSKIAVVPGRYRLGVKSTSSDYGYLWMPSTGLLSPNAFTIEFWLESDVPFSQLDGETPVSVSGIAFQFYAHELTAVFTNSDAYPQETVQISSSVASLPANVWENFALTYDAGTLVLYVNGAAVGSRSGVSPPQVWSDNSRADGLTIGGAGGRGATDLAVSDLRLSRIARIPGRRTPAVHPTLAVTTVPTGAHVHQTLLGGLHTLTTPATVRMAHGVLRVIRTDKLINSTPIKLGPPDAAYPSQGISGVFSYNWAVVDRTMAYLHQLGVEPYLSVDSTPQLLGGAYGPFAGLQLTTDRSYLDGFNPQVPDNLQAWQLIVEDLTYHILKQDHVRVAYWGVWNEPDGSEFWLGTISQYLALYQATVDGIRAVDPTAVVGGAETGSWQPAWVSALIAYCAAEHVPLNFVSWHYYSGDLGEIGEAQATVGALAAEYHIPTPFLNVGEWTWETANLPGTGLLPFSAENYFLNDWGAAFVGASLIEMQRDGVVASVYTNPVASRGGTGYAGSGLMSPTGPWAPFNVYRLWSMLPDRVVRTRLDADPGIFALAAKDRRTLAVLIVSLHYPSGRFGVTLEAPKGLAGRTVRIWLVDRRHADAYDAGPRHAALRSTTRTLSGSGQLHLLLPARAVALVQIPLR